MERPKRQRKQTQKIELITKSKWTLKERRQLLEALKTHGKNNVEQLASCIETKTAKEVQFYLHSLSLRAKRITPKIDSDSNSSLEIWLHLAEELTYGIEDHAMSISKVLSLAGNLEPHVPLRTYRDADYSNIYQYLAALLSGDDLPPLQDLSAAVIVELLKDTNTFLRSLDTSVQRRLMLQKYQFLKGPTKGQNPEEVYEANRRALENDFDFTEINGIPANEAPQVKPSSSQPTATTSSNATPDGETHKNPGQNVKGKKTDNKQVPLPAKNPSSQPAAATVSSLTPGGTQPLPLVKNLGDTRMLLLPGPRGAMIPVPVPKIMVPGTKQQKVHLSFPPGFVLPPGRYRFEPIITPHGTETGKLTPDGTQGNKAEAGSSATGGKGSVVTKQGPRLATGVTPSGMNSAKVCTVATPSSTKTSEGHPVMPSGGSERNESGTEKETLRAKSPTVMLERLSCSRGQKSFNLTSSAGGGIASKSLPSPTASKGSISGNVNSGSQVKTKSSASNMASGVVSQASTSGQSECQSMGRSRGKKRPAEQITEADSDCAAKKMKKRMKRPALHSLNPLCIPISYLDPRPKLPLTKGAPKKNKKTKNKKKLARKVKI